MSAGAGALLATPALAQDTVVAYYISAADGADGFVTDPVIYRELPFPGNPV